MNKTLRSITILVTAGTILANACAWTHAQAERTLVVPFGQNKELAPAHDVYKFPYKENYIMLPLTNGTMVTEDGGMRVIVNKPVQLNKRRPTVIPLGHGAPNVSPTPIVPQGFNGGSVPLPVNRPEGVVVRRIYPEQEFITSSESSPEVKTYEEPPVVERTEALPSVVSQEEPTPEISQEHSIVTQPQTAPAETPLSTSGDEAQATPSPYETSTPSPYTSTPSDSGTPSETTSPSDYGTPSETTTPSEYGSPSGSDTPSDSGTPSGNDTPSDYGPPSDTSTDPYQTDYSYETPQEPETPTSAWRSTTSNPAETYDSGMVSESPMIMTHQESNQYENPWETQSARPQIQESVSPAVTAPVERTEAAAQMDQRNTASPSGSQTDYVEVRPRRHSASRTQQNRNSGASPGQGASVYSPKPQSAPQMAPQTVPQTVPQYQPPREVPAQLPPPDPNQQMPRPSGDGRKV